MIYLGSKQRLSKEIVPILQKIINNNNITTYIEPFVGGANIIDKIYCENKIGYDKKVTLIALHQFAQVSPELIPIDGDKIWFDEAKAIYKKYKGSTEMNKEMPLWKIGAIEFFRSYSGGGFVKGYVNDSDNRNYYKERYNNFIKQISSPLYKAIDFQCSEYLNIPQYKNALFYCDPPYQNTTTYQYAWEGKINYTEYWNWVRELSKNNYVICSEQTFPKDFNIIWEKQVKRMTGLKNRPIITEKLGAYSLGKPFINNQ